MYILGISAFYHDSSVALIKDGQVIAAAEEERFSRVKHSFQFPYKALEYCLKEAGISMGEVAYVGYYEKVLLRFERVLDSIVQAYPFSLGLFLKGIPEWLGEKIRVENYIRGKAGYKGKIFYVPHHLSHASASYYASGFPRAAILTVDGIGEYQTTGLWTGVGPHIGPIKQLSYPHSLGLLYSTFTAFLGFRIIEDEYKVMGLAAYGKPRFVDQIHTIIDTKEDGSFQLNMDYFSFHRKMKMWSKKFELVFGKSRIHGEPITAVHKDIAASIQQVTEEIYFKMLNYLYTMTKSKNICLGGGVALNALANGKLFANTPFEHVYIIGPAGDGGNALGAAFYIYNSILHSKKRTRRLESLYLGTSYSDRQIETSLRSYNLVFTKYKDKNELVTRAAMLLSQNKIIGWFQGRMEYGPRALGARSILAKPSPRSMKHKVNTIKIREQFRPFAGSILQDAVHKYFEVPEPNHYSPFMLFCFKVKADKRENLAAIVHKDGTCRIQTVNSTNGIYYDLIKKFYAMTGIPCILNTSFNLKGEPIVENPTQAIEDFMKTSMDALVIGNYLALKKPRIKGRNSEGSFR